LIQRQDVRNRLVRLAGAQDLQRTTTALDDAGQRLSRLFLTQLALNAGFGLVIGLGLWIIGVPSAPLWGMLAMILRFVPYVGVLISAVFPLILAAAVGPGWTMALLTAALFLTAETIAGQAIEPLLYGQSTGLSPVAVIAAATFWTWLWGPIGLVLATPLTMCLAVVGKHVDRLKFLEVLFGDEPPLTPAELIYQRMLARDPIEAAEQAQAFLKKKSLLAYYDEILLEGLKLAQADAKRDLLDEDRQQRIRDAVAEIVDDLGDHEDEPPPEAEAESEEQPLARLEKIESPRAVRLLPAQWQSGTPVLCVPGMGLLDEAAALVVARLVAREGIGARRAGRRIVDGATLQLGHQGSCVDLPVLRRILHTGSNPLRHSTDPAESSGRNHSGRALWQCSRDRRAGEVGNDGVRSTLACRHGRQDQCVGDPRREARFAGPADNRRSHCARTAIFTQGASPRWRRASMKLFKCQACGQLLYFENTTCEKCAHRLGYLPQINTLSALKPQDGGWRALAAGDRLTGFAPTPNSMFAIGWSKRPGPTYTA
jgi:hypothetical protein